MGEKYFRETPPKCFKSPEKIFVVVKFPQGKERTSKRPFPLKLNPGKEFKRIYFNPGLGNPEPRFNLKDNPRFWKNNFLAQRNPMKEGPRKKRGNW